MSTSQHPANTANWDVQPNGQSNSWPLHGLSLPLHVQSSLVGQFILIRRLRIFQSHRAMVGRFSSPTDETVLFNFHSCKSLYIIYSARALSTLCILWHLVCGSCCTLGECLKIFILSHSNQVSPPLMYSLMHRVPELKETQLGTVQPYSAGPAEQSVQEPVVEVSCILMSSLVFTLSGTLLQLWHCWVNMRHM